MRAAASGLEILSALKAAYGRKQQSDLESDPAFMQLPVKIVLPPVN
jgi:hypothetical protein